MPDGFAATNQADVDALMDGLARGRSSAPAPPPKAPRWTLQEIEADPEFQRFTPRERRTLLQGFLRNDPDFNALPESDRPAMENVFLSRYPDDARPGDLILSPDEVRKRYDIKYVYGGNDPKTGLDCSSFMQCLYKRQGIHSLPRTADEQWRATNGQNLPGNNWDTIEPGDQLFFQGTNGRPAGAASHTGFYLGKDASGRRLFVHASSTAGGVTVSDVDAYPLSRLGVKRYPVFAERSAAARQQNEAPAVQPSAAQGSPPPKPSALTNNSTGKPNQTARTGAAPLDPFKATLEALRTAAPFVPALDEVAEGMEATRKMRGKSINQAAIQNLRGDVDIVRSRFVEAIANGDTNALKQVAADLVGHEQKQSKQYSLLGSRALGSVGKFIFSDLRNRIGVGQAKGDDLEDYQVAGRDGKLITLKPTPFRRAWINLLRSLPPDQAQALYAAAEEALPGSGEAPEFALQNAIAAGKSGPLGQITYGTYLLGKHIAKDPAQIAMIAAGPASAVRGAPGKISQAIGTIEQVANVSDKARRLNAAVQAGKFAGHAGVNAGIAYQGAQAAGTAAAGDMPYAAVPGLALAGASMWGLAHSIQKTPEMAAGIRQGFTPRPIQPPSAPEEITGVLGDAIKSAMAELHPDRVPEQWKPVAEELFKQVNALRKPGKEGGSISDRKAKLLNIQEQWNQFKAGNPIQPEAPVVETPAPTRPVKQKQPKAPSTAKPVEQNGPIVKQDSAAAAAPMPQGDWSPVKSKTYQPEEFDAFSSRFNRGDFNGALGATAKAVAKDGLTRYLYGGNANGIQSSTNPEDVSPSVYRYYEVTKGSDGVTVRQMERPKPWETHPADAPIETPAPPTVSETPRPVETVAPPTGADRISRLYQGLTDHLVANGPTTDPKALRGIASALLQGDFDPSNGAHVDELYDALEAVHNRAFANEHLQPQPPDVFVQNMRDAVAAENALARRARSAEVADRQQFSTPIPIATAAQHAARVRNGEIVLEPNAGTGSLVDQLRYSAHTIIANEIDPRRVAVLKAMGSYMVREGDALRLPLDDVRADVAIMNPPWGKYTTGKYGKPIGMEFTPGDVAERFVAMTMKTLPDGGRLVAVMPTTMLGPAGAPFRKWIADNHTLQAVVQSPPGAYDRRGTSVDSLLVVIDKGKHTSAPGVFASGPNAPTDWDTYSALVNGIPERAVSAGVEKPTGPLNGIKGEGVANGPQSGVAGARPGGSAAVANADSRSGDALHPTGEPGDAQPTGRERGSDVVPAQASSDGSGAEAPSPQGVVPASDGIEPAGGKPDGQAAREPAGKPAKPVERSKELSEQVEAASRSALFAPYEVRSGQRLSPHPRAVVETQALAGAPYPAVTYQPHSAVLEALRRKVISDEQYDVIAATGQAFDRGHGILVADDVGLGKSREIAGIAVDNLQQGKANRIIISTFNDNNVSGMMGEIREVAGALASGYQIVRVTDYKEAKKLGAGSQGLPLLDKAIYLIDSYNFAPYSIALKGIEADLWLADEAHKYKNVEGAKIGAAWRDLHVDLMKRNKRIAYFTATPATTPEDLQYLYALKEWSIDKGGFSDFMQRVQGRASEEKEIQAQIASESPNLASMIGMDSSEQGGRGSRWGGSAQSVFSASMSIPEMEQVMRELKRKGKYIARDLWRGGVEFDVRAVAPSPRDVTSFNRVVELARKVDETWRMFSGANAKGSGFGPRGMLQNEIKRRLFDIRLGHIIPEALEALSRGEQVVIYTESVNEVGENAGQMAGAINMINTWSIESYDDGSFSDPTEIPEAVMAVAELHEMRRELPGLASPIERMEKAFGKNNVALIIGETSANMRMKMMDDFQKGKRRVAVISAAGTTGINLHDAMKGTGRRHLMMADFQWKADDFKQTLGRVDRSGQLTSPKITFYHMGQAAERKFIATIANRMQSLGALSKGQGGSAGGGELSTFEIFGSLGIAAMHKTWATLPEELANWFMAKAFRDTSNPDAPARSIEGASLKQFLLELQLMPLEVAQRIEAAFVRSYEEVAGEASEGEQANIEKQQGQVLRSTEIAPELVLHEVRDEAGHKKGILEGVFMLPPRGQAPRMGKITRALNATEITPEGYAARPVMKRYISFRDTKSGKYVSGLVVPPSKMQHVAESLGASLSRAERTPETVMIDLQAGDKIPLFGAEGSTYTLRMRQDGKIAIEGAKTAHKDVLKGTGAQYSPVGSYWFLQPEDILGFLERFPLQESTRSTTGPVDGTPGPDSPIAGAPGIGGGRPTDWRDSFRDAGKAVQAAVRSVSRSTVGEFASEVKEDVANATTGNLSRLGRVSPTAAMAARQAAPGSSRAQAVVQARAAIPKMAKAYGGNLDRFFMTLAESRLRGIRSRWQQMAADAHTGEVLKAYKYRGEERTRLADRMEMALSALAGTKDEYKEAYELAKSMASAVIEDPSAEDALRALLQQTFTDAAANTGMMGGRVGEDFDKIVTEQRFQDTLAIYKNLIEKELARSHSENEGVFSDSLGPLDTYYPLVPYNEEGDFIGGRPGGKAPLGKPKNQRNHFATGQADFYETTIPALVNAITTAYRTNNKAKLVMALEQAKLLRPIKFDENGEPISDGQPVESITVGDAELPAMKVNGKLVPAKEVPITTDKLLLQGDESTFLGARKALVPIWLVKELAPIVPEWQEPTRMPNRLQRIIHATNTFGLAGPLDAVFHTTNLLGTLVSETPWLGESMLSKLASVVPVTKLFSAIANVIHTDVSDESAIADLQEMARLGLVSDRYGSVTISKRYAELADAEVRRLSFTAFLYGPNGVDIRARLLLFRLAKEINGIEGPIANPKKQKEIAEFVDRLGQYNRGLEGSIIRWAKDTGLGPFATAGSTMLRNGIRFWLGMGSPNTLPTRGQRTSRRVTLKVAQLLSGGAIGLLALWAFLHKAQTGKWPGEDKDARFLELPLTPDQRKSPIAQRVFGPGDNTAYVGLGWLNPIGYRGSTATGIRSAYNTGKAGGTGGQQVEAAAKDVLNAGLHPITSGPFTHGAFTALTGTSPYITSLRDPVSGRPTLEFRNEIGRAKPGVGRLGQQGLEGALSTNSLVQDTAALFGIGHQADQMKGQGKDQKIVRMILDLVAPRAITGARDREREETRLLAGARAAERTPVPVSDMIVSAIRSEGLTVPEMTPGDGERPDAYQARLQRAARVLEASIPRMLTDPRFNGRTRPERQMILDRLVGRIQSHSRAPRPEEPLWLRQKREVEADAAR